jgi:hypothetical protein
MQWLSGVNVPKILLFSVQLGLSDKLPDDLFFPVTCIVYWCCRSAVLFAFVPIFCVGYTAGSKRNWRNPDTLLFKFAFLRKNGKCFYSAPNLSATFLLHACLTDRLYICRIRNVFGFLCLIGQVCISVGWAHVLTRPWVYKFSKILGFRRVTRSKFLTVGPQLWSGLWTSLLSDAFRSVYLNCNTVFW